MKNHASLLLLLASIALGVFTTNVAYGQSKTGTTIGQFLLIEPSARVAGMGNAGVTAHEEILSAYFNPGAIGLQRGYGVQISHSEWLAGINYNYAAAGLQAGEIGSLFIHLTSLNSGDIDVRTVEQPLGTGERYSVSNIALGLGFGRQISDRFSVGAQISYVQETIWHSSLTSVAFSMGTVYMLSGNGLRLGASVSNFGPPAKYSGRDIRIRYDEDPSRYGDNSSLPAELFTESFALPILFRVGVAWPLQFSEKNRLLLAADAFHPNDNTESMSLGAEWQLLNTLALRGGYQNLFLKDSEVGLTLGAGLNFGFEELAIRVDYAWADHGRLENAQRFSLGVTF